MSQDEVAASPFAEKLVAEVRKSEGDAQSVTYELEKSEMEAVGTKE